MKSLFRGVKILRDTGPQISVVPLTLRSEYAPTSNKHRTSKCATC